MANIAKGQDLLRDVYVTSDRYAYLAAIPLFVLAGWMMARLLHRWPRTTMAACCCVIIAMIIGTYRQAQTWHDTETLFRNVLASHPNAHVAHENIGSILYQRGEKVAALQAYQAALEIRPNSAVFFNLGIIALDVGQDAKAEELFRRAVELRPNDAQALTNLGALLLRRGARDEARAVLERAVALPDAPPEARANLELLRP
jgi:Flp pilus assembly protein TadD